MNVRDIETIKHKLEESQPSPFDKRRSDLEIHRKMREMRWLECIGVKNNQILLHKLFSVSFFSFFQLISSFTVN